MTARACKTCRRWSPHPPPSRYGRCAKAKRGPQPYWVGTVTTYGQIDTADVHGGECEAWNP